MTATEEPTHESETLDRHEWHHRKHRRLLVAAIMIVIIFTIGALAGHAASIIQQERFGGYAMNGSGGGMMRDDNANGSYSGMGMQTANLQRIEGVVTSVNGSTLVVAGSGATNTVTTNSSTQYSGGNQAVTNDTVVVFGTTSNGVFTASRIDINPQMP